MSQNVKIQFAEGAQDIGLAIMLHDLLTQNIEQHPRKQADFKKLNLPVGLNVCDDEFISFWISTRVISPLGFRLNSAFETKPWVQLFSGFPANSSVGRPKLLGHMI